MWNCLANSLNRQKTHMRARAQMAVFIFLIITNLITAPAIITAIMSLRNQASVTEPTKLSKPMMAAAKQKPNTKVSRLLEMKSMRMSWVQIIMQINQKTPMMTRWMVKTVSVLPKIICKQMATTRITMQMEQVTMLYVSGKYFRYWMFHGRINISARPITVVMIIVFWGSLNIQQSYPTSLNKMQAFLCSAKISLPQASKQLVSKFMIIYRFFQSFMKRKSRQKTTGASVPTDCRELYRIVELLVQAVKLMAATFSGSYAILTRNWLSWTLKNINSHEKG